MTLTRSPVRGSQSQLVASENLSPIRINAFGYRALLAAHSSPKRETPSPATIPLKHYKEGTRPGTPRPYMEDEEVTGQLEHRAKTRIEVRTATPQIGSQKGPVPRPWMTLPRSAATFQKGLTVRSIPQATRSRVTRWSESIVAPVNPLLPASPKETESEAEAPAPAPVEPGPVPEIRCVSPSTVNHQSLAEGYVADAESILEDEYAAPAEQEYDAGVGSATPLSTFFEADLSIHQSQPFIDGRQVVTNDMLRERLDSANYSMICLTFTC